MKMQAPVIIENSRLFKQLRYEADTWKRHLSFIMEENIRMKNRLTEILKDHFDQRLLPDLDSFQEILLREDARIGLLRDDIAKLDPALETETASMMRTKMAGIRQLMAYAEKNALQLKQDFNLFLTNNV